MGEMVYRFFLSWTFNCIFKPHVKLKTLQSHKMQKQQSNMSVHHVYMEKHQKREMTQQHWLRQKKYYSLYAGLSTGVIILIIPFGDAKNGTV